MRVKLLMSSILQTALPTVMFLLHFSYEPLLSVVLSAQDFRKIGLKCRTQIHAPQTEVAALLYRPAFISPEQWVNMCG